MLRGQSKRLSLPVGYECCNISRLHSNVPGTDSHEREQTLGAPFSHRGLGDPEINGHFKDGHQLIQAVRLRRRTMFHQIELPSECENTPQ
jgi:hypothetical protein